MSTIASGFSSLARLSASARMSRPSASVLSTSTVLPLRMRSTSPGRIALPLGMFSTSGTNPITRVFTPRSRSADIAAITAAAPDMSVFIVSMPPAVLSDRPPESNTTPLPTSASVALRAARLVREPQEARRAIGARRRRRAHRPAARARAARRPTPHRQPVGRARARARASRPSPATSPPPARSRGRAPTRRPPRSARRAPSPSRTFAFARPSTCTRASCVGLASDLYVRNWYAPSATPSANACAASAAIERVGRDVEQRGRDLLDLRRPPGQRGTRPPHARRRRSCRDHPCRRAPRPSRRAGRRWAPRAPRRACPRSRSRP